MQVFTNDPCGVIPVDFETSDYKVVGYKLIRLTLYVMIQPHDTDFETQFKYKRILQDVMRSGRRIL